MFLWWESNKRQTELICSFQYKRKRKKKQNSDIFVLSAGHVRSWWILVVTDCHFCFPMYIWNQDYYFPVVFGLCCEKLLASTVNTWSFTTSSSSNHSVKETTAMTVLSPSLVQSHPSLLLWQPDTLWHKGILPERGLWEIHFVKVSFASNIQPQQYVRTQEERTARDTDDTFSWRILRWGWGGSVSMVLYCTIEKCVCLFVCVPGW